MYISTHALTSSCTDQSSSSSSSHISCSISTTTAGMCLVCFLIIAEAVSLRVVIISRANCLHESSTSLFDIIYKSNPLNMNWLAKWTEWMPTRHEEPRLSLSDTKTPRWIELWHYANMRWQPNRIGPQLYSFWSLSTSLWEQKLMNTYIG